VGARVNGRLVPLRTPLVNGDIVEILTSPVSQPSRDWLAFVVTSRGRNKIRAFLQTKEKQKSIEIGRRFLDKELKKVKRTFGKLVDAKAFDAVLPELGVARVDDLLAEIGYGKIPPRVVVQKLFPQEEPAGDKGGISRTEALRKVVRKILPIGATGILVRGENDLLATLARCCRPVPGEEIVGYVTRGRGVSVHSAACPNVRNLLFDPSREIEVEWHAAKDASFTVDFEVQVEDRPGILARITQVISDAGSNIEAIEARTSPGRTAVIEGSATTPDRRHLDKLLLAIRAVPGVTSVRRKFNVSRLGPR
jgi:GTP pyrophosphokinase